MLQRVRLSVKRGMAPAPASFIEVKALLDPPLQPLMPGSYDFAPTLIRTRSVIADARIEPSLAGGNSDAAVQFERLGYFCPDKDSRPARLVFNRTVGLRDTWAKVSGTFLDRVGFSEPPSRAAPISHAAFSVLRPAGWNSRRSTAEQPGLAGVGAIRFGC
jgi:hypothetical protein